VKRANIKILDPGYGLGEEDLITMKKILDNRSKDKEDLTIFASRARNMEGVLLRLSLCF
jgi:hypothetical protein